MTISVRQSELTKVASSPYTTNALGSTPIEGNLLVAIAEERAGGTALSMSNAGWTLGAEAYQSPSDGTYRKAHATWYKIAGASEPTTVTVTKTGGDVDAILVGYAEIQGDAGEMATIAFGAGIATGNDNVASFHDSGSTSSVVSTNKVLVGHCFTKVGSGTEAPYSDWTAGTDDLTEFIEEDDSVSGLDGSWAWATSTTSGANSTRATKDGGTTDANRGAIVSLLVFTVGATPVTGVATAAFGGTFTAAGEITGPPVKYLSQGAAVAGTTSITTAAYGTGWAEGDLGVCVVASNHTTEATEPTVTGFTNVGTLNGGGGAQGAGTGNRRLTFFTRALLSGDDTTPAIDLATGNVMVAAITILRKPPGYTWQTAVAAFGAETTAGTIWSEAMTTNPVLDAEDMAVLACAVRDTSGSSAEGITATGATFGTVTERADLASETGNDINLHVSTCDVLTGPSSAAPTRTATHATSETGVMGVLRIRATAASVSGAASGAFGFTGAASGVPTTFGAAAASVGFTGTAAGIPEVFGVAAAALGFTGTALGEIVVPSVEGQASADFGGTFDALGIDRALGQATASLGGSFTALGVDRALGLADASLGGTFTASGTTGATLGQATATFGGTFTATGPWPTAETTGSSGTLTPNSTDTLDTNGATYTDIEFTHTASTVQITGDNITFTNCQFNGSPLWSTLNPGTVTDCTFIDGFGVSSSSSIIFLRAKIENFTDDAMHVSADNPPGPPVCANITIRDSYIFNSDPAAEAHADGLHVRGSSNFHLDNCYIHMGPGFSALINAAIFFENANGGNTDILIENCFLQGSGEYTAYLNTGSGVVQNNTFGTANSGIFSAAVSDGITGEGNKERDGTPIDLHPGGTVTGVAVASFGGTGTAAGVPETFGVAVAALGFTGTAAGVPETFGAAVASLGFTGSASGTIASEPVTGVAVAAFGFTGSALGVDRALGDAAASFGYTGSASGIDRALGVALAAFGYTAAGAGQRRVFAVAVIAFGFDGTAAGVNLSIVAPPERTYSVAAETRTSAVAAQSRTTTVLAESRTTEVS